MHLSRARVAGLAIIIVAALVSSGARVQAQACAVSRGDHVILASLDLDPDVFVWDSAQRLIDYVAGDFNTSLVLRHTILVRPGTKATAVECKDGVAHPKFASKNADIVGLRITSGAIRGRYGWVLAEDVRRMDGKPVTAFEP